MDFPTFRKFVLIHEVGITECADDEFVKMKMEVGWKFAKKRGKAKKKKKKKKNASEKINTIIKS